MQKKDLKFLLLEGIHQNALDYLNKKGYTNIEYHKKALNEEELIEAIRDAHFVGLRSKTKITENVLKNAPNLLAIGAFCIGTNQIDLNFAKQRKIPVFNAPFSNTRSVAELVIAEIIMLMRGIPEKNMAAHQGKWMKSAVNSYEIRGKNLGIIGYGNIGSQISYLAEAFGMKVYFYDTKDRLIVGNAKSCCELEELLKISDVITLHVPATAETKNMINKEKLSLMKKGSYLINASRGDVIVIADLVEKLKEGHLLGASIDVFPQEPCGADDEFISELRGLNNVLLTPHIGGSTQEAQQNIAIEIAQKFDKYFETGCVKGAVNL